MVKFSRDSEQQIEAFERKLARREITGSLDVTLEMAKVLRNVVNSCRWTSKDMLLELVKLAQLRLAEAQPIEIAVTSTGHRVGMIIAEEAKALKDEAAQAKEVKEPFVEGQEFVDPSAKQIMRDLIRQGIAEIIEEQETATSNIAVQCFDHIHSNEIILTMGRCKVVEAFLTEAAKSLKFQVIVAETAPNFEGHQLAVNLAKAGIETTVIADCAIFAFMARVNKVILGAHAVSSNGGIISDIGSKIVCSAARHHATPVVVCAPLHTLSPGYPYNTDRFNLCVSPQLIVGFDQVRDSTLDMPNPIYEYVSPDLIALFITNAGPHPPAYIQRLVQDYH